MNQLTSHCYDSFCSIGSAVHHNLLWHFLQLLYILIHQLLLPNKCIVITTAWHRRVALRYHLLSVIVGRADQRDGRLLAEDCVCGGDCLVALENILSRYIITMIVVHHSLPLVLSIALQFPHVIVRFLWYGLLANEYRFAAVSIHVVCIEVYCAADLSILLFGSANALLPHH